MPSPHASPALPTRELPLPARAGIRAGGAALGAVFAGVSRLRSAKSLHPYGAVHACELEIGGAAARPDLLAGVELLTTPATHRGIVRFSRSLGLPESAPDIHGMAIRLPDLHGRGHHQDLLLVSSGDGLLVHHLFVPGYGYFSRPYSSVLAFRGRGGAFLLAARLAAGAPRPRGGGSELADLLAAATTGRLRYDFGVAPLTGSMVAVGALSVGERLDPSLEGTRFNPANTGGGLQPSDPVNRMRRRVYERSQEGWGG
jgi:hypothetical protein